MIKRHFNTSAWLWSGSSILTFILLWECFSFLGVFNNNLLPPPSSVISTIFRSFTQGALLTDIFSSLRRVLVGFIIGSVLGITLGLECAFIRKVGYVIKPLIELIRPIPPIAWIPLSILWFGFGEPSAYFLVSLGAFFPIFNSTFLGISQVNKGTVEVARCHGANRKILFWKIILPQALPSIFSGLRTALGVSWMVVITAELVGVQSGLGYFIQVSRAQLQTDQVLAGMIVIGIIGLLLNHLLKMLAKWAMPWKWRDQKIGYDE